MRQVDIKEMSILKAFYISRINLLRELLGEFVNSPVVFDDERLDYVEIQVPKKTIAEAKKLLGGNKP